MIGFDEQTIDGVQVSPIMTTDQRITELARETWNAHADEFNQWDTLGMEELTVLVNAVCAGVTLGREVEREWRDIETLTSDDGYVLGWQMRDDECHYREYFLGIKYDIRSNALLNQWSGRWREVSKWLPLPAPPTRAQNEGNEW